jgi:uncharacterized protein YutE (UPF0331/DUF86 family)
MIPLPDRCSPATTGARRLPLAVYDVASSLAEHHVVPPSVAESVTAFWKLRSRVVHASDATREEILRAIDVGLDLLRLLSTLPGTPAPDRS